MTSKYANNIEKYKQELESKQNFSTSHLNFIGVTKKSPKIYIQLFSDIIPVPMHSYIEVPQKDGSKRQMNFICRHFIDEECYICDNIKDDYGNLVKPKTSRLAIVAQFENLGRNAETKTVDYSPIFETVTLQKDKAESILEEWPDLKYTENDDNYVFEHIPRVGIFDAKKAVDDYFAVTLSEMGSIDDRIFMVKREGEGLQTRYSTMNVGDGFTAEDAEIFKPAIAMHMSVDDYIDMFISEGRYKRAFGLEEAKHENSGHADVVSEHDDSEDEDDSEEDISMEDIMKKYRGASAKNRHDA